MEARAIDALMRHGLLDTIVEPEQSLVLELRAKCLVHMRKLRLEIAQETEVPDEAKAFGVCIDTICALLTNGRLDLEKRSINLANRAFRKKVTRWHAAKSLLTDVGGMQFKQFTAVIPTPCDHSRLCAAVTAIRNIEASFPPGAFRASVLLQLEKASSCPPASNTIDRRSLLEEQDAAYEASLRIDAARATAAVDIKEEKDQKEDEEDLPEWHNETREERRRRLAEAFSARYSPS